MMKSRLILTLKSVIPGHLNNYYVKKDIQTEAMNDENIHGL